jgi:hypothetical protein
MTRFLTFAILGPPLGFVTLFWGLLGTLGLALGEPPEATRRRRLG